MSLRLAMKRSLEKEATTLESPPKSAPDLNRKAGTAAKEKAPLKSPPESLKRQGQTPEATLDSPAELLSRNGVMPNNIRELVIIMFTIELH